MKSARGWLLATWTVMAGVSFAHAKDYTVEFDCYMLGSTICQSNPDVGDYGTFGTEVLSTHGWVTLGYGNGSKMQNATGQTLVAIRMKVRTPGDTFRVGPIAGGHLFGAVFRKKDGTELIFNRGNSGTGIEDGQTFWSRVVPQSPGYNTSTPDFDGMASASQFSDPVDHPDQWDPIRPSSPGPSGVWTDLFATMPADISRIDLYDEFDKAKIVVYSSNGAIFVFDGRARKHYRLRPNGGLPNGINRISVDQGKFILWKNGVPELRFDAMSPPVGPAIANRAVRAESNGKPKRTGSE